MVGLGLLALFLGTQDLRSMASALANIEPTFIVPATLSYFLGVYLRAARWRLLVKPFADVPTLRLFRIAVIGFSVNNILPLRLGEIVRPFLLRKSHGVPIASTLATVLIERFLDLFALCGLMTIVLLSVPLEGLLLAVGGSAATITSVGLLGLFVILVIPRALVERLFAWGTGLAAKIHPRLGRLAASIVDGIRVLEDGRAVLVIVPLSILCWIAELGLYYFLMLALKFQASVFALTAGMVIANLVTILPSLPGYVGTFDVALKTALTESFGIEDAVAGAYTILTHAVLLLPVVIVGLVLLAWEDLSFQALTQGRVQSRTSPDDNRIESAP